jgi:hypothetical protein
VSAGEEVLFAVVMAGTALTLAQPEDEIMVRQIEKVLGASPERRKLAGFTYEGFDPLSRRKSSGNSKPAPRPNGNGRRPNASGRRPGGNSRGRCSASPARA